MAASLQILVPRLRALLASGFAADADGALSGLLQGLAHPLADTPGWIVSQRLLAVRPQLASNNELVCALLIRRPEVRCAWVAIAAARCIEAGQMQDGMPLLQLVSGLQGAAAWVEEALPNAQLAESPHVEQERELLGASVAQAAATPALMRILAVAALLAQPQTLPALPTIKAGDMEMHWIKGRLLALPETLEAKRPLAAHCLLHGAFDASNGHGASATPSPQPSPARGEGANESLRKVFVNDQTSMAWVFANPWPLLLAMLVYAQDIWKAEARGGLLLELSHGQNAFSPGEISVLVQGVEGDETRCGSLADLLLKSLAHLGISCFPRQPAPGELNDSLSSLVGLLLSRQVWRYQDGASGQNGLYQIHPSFADACFRLPGSKVFSRTGRMLWQAIRINAEAMRDERRSGSFAPEREK